MNKHTYLAILLLVLTMTLILQLMPVSVVAQGLEGRLAPNFTVSLLDGTSLTPSDLRGQPVLINFWATWCPPCREEMPIIQDFFENQDKIAIVGISVGESASTVGTFIRTNGYTFPIGLDSQNRIATQYLVRFLPTTLLLDQDGIILHRYIGLLSTELLGQWLEMFTDEAVSSLAE